MCARSNAARDLMHSNLPLLWMVANRYDTNPAGRGQLLDMLRLPQRAVLTALIGEPVREAQVRFLRKVILDGAEQRSLASLAHLVADSELVLRLRHWRVMPGALLTLLAEAPVLAEFNLLRQEVADAADDYDLRRIRRLHGQLLRDTVRMAGMLHPDGGLFRPLIRCRGWQALKTLHDELMAMIRELGWDKVLGTGVDPAQALPAAPIPSCSRFTAIRTIAELIDEGERMHHCVVTRAPEVLAGRSAIYRVNIGAERATIEVFLGPDGEPIGIEDFRLACNAAPSPAAWATANQWLYEARRRWTPVATDTDLRRVRRRA
jgi:hypothetical protein